MTADQVAEDAMAYTRVVAGGEREELDGVVLTDQGTGHQFMRTAARIRMGDPGSTIAAVREWFAARGGQPFTWWLGPATRPEDLAERLLASGARPDPGHGATATALVLDRPPAEGDGDPEIREVRSFEDFAAMQQIIGMADESRLPAMWEEAQRRRSVVRAYLAILDGRPVSVGRLAVATSGHGILSGGATLPEYRGRGCYAALVRHRWAVAQDELGLDALVTQASEGSRPILERLGLRRVATLTVLVDGKN